jgi:uncharacterized protein YbjQ (UPF0145 family)
MDYPQFDNSEIDVIRGYYSKNAVKITQGRSRQGRGIHVVTGNVSINYVKSSSVYEWQLVVGNAVIAAGSHVLLEAVLYDSQQAVKRMKQAATTLEVRP